MRQRTGNSFRRFGHGHEQSERTARKALIKAGAKLDCDNVYALELENGSRVLALPGSDESIRGLTVDGWIVADEAAHLPHDMICLLYTSPSPRDRTRFCHVVHGVEP